MPGRGCRQSDSGLKRNKGKPRPRTGICFGVTSKPGVAPMAAEPKDGNSVDPFEAFRGMRDSYLDAMSKVMINAVNSEEYPHASHRRHARWLVNGIRAFPRSARQSHSSRVATGIDASSRQEVAALARDAFHSTSRCAWTTWKLKLGSESSNYVRWRSRTSAGASPHEKAKAKGVSLPQRKSP